MALIKHNYPRSQHRGPVPVGSQFASEPALRPANQSNNQQMLAQALRDRSIMPQQQLTEQERMMIMQLMQQGMSQEQAMQQVMSMRNN
jgi:hypothetical protein